MSNFTKNMSGADQPQQAAESPGRVRGAEDRVHEGGGADAGVLRAAGRRIRRSGPVHHPDAQ